MITSPRRTSGFLRFTIILASLAILAACGEDTPTDPVDPPLPPPPDPTADVAVDVAGPASADVGAPFEYTVSVSNPGDADASSVQVTQTLPAGVLLKAVTDGGVEQAGEVTWPAVAGLPAGAERAYRVTVVSRKAQTLNTSARATTTSEDANPANNDGSGPEARLSTVVGTPGSCAPPVADLPLAAVKEETTAFIDVNLVHVDGRGVVPGQTVIVSDGRVAEIGDAGAVTPPAGAVIVEGGGCRYLVPGLVDMHTHIGFTSDPVLLLYYGVTTARNVWSSQGLVNFRESIRSGASVGPNLVLGSQGFSDTAFFAGTIVLQDPSEADAKVAELVAGGWDFIKVHETLRPDIYAAIEEAVLAHGTTFSGHVPFNTGTTMVLGSTQRSIEHWPNAFVADVRTDPTTSWWNGSIDDAKVRTLAQRVRAAGKWMTPTMATLLALLDPAEEAAFTNRPDAVYLPAQRLAAWQDRGPWGPGSIRAATIANTSRVIRIFHEEGVPMLVGTDMGFTYVMPGSSMREEATMWLDAGIPDEVFLRAATLSPAEFFGVPGEFGEINVGARADLVLLDGNPLYAVDNLRTQAGVMSDGRWYSQIQLRDFLDQLFGTASLRSDGGASLRSIGPNRQLGEAAHSH